MTSTAKTLASYTGAQLVEFFNANCALIDAKPVKKFADRKSAERRCALVAEAMAAAAKAGKKGAKAKFNGACPKCGADHNSGSLTTGRVKDNKDGTQTESHMTIDTCHACGTDFDNRTGRIVGESADRSAAISASWADPEVAAARAARHQVKVGKEVFKSFAAACRALKIDLTSHIKARGTMVAEGKVEFRGHKFTLVS